jgi:hypothetical protein
MAALGIPDCFAQWVCLLFTGAEATVHLNGQTTESFSIERGVCQGCSLAPYLFLFIGKALNIATKCTMEMGNLEGIHLPHGVGQQIILQYANNTNFTLIGMAQNLLIVGPLSPCLWSSYQLVQECGILVGSDPSPGLAEPTAVYMERRASAFQVTRYSIWN